MRNILTPLRRVANLLDVHTAKNYVVCIEDYSSGGYYDAVEALVGTGTEVIQYFVEYFEDEDLNGLEELSDRLDEECDSSITIYELN